MNDNKKAVSLFDKSAELYMQKYMDVNMYENSLQHFNEGLKPGALIFDMGCGPGNMLKYLSERNPHYILYGKDLSPNMIALAEMNVPSAQLEVGDCLHPEKGKNKYDGVICNFLIPYLDESELVDLIAGIYDVLSDGGKLLLGFIAGDNNSAELVQSSTGDTLIMNYYSLSFIYNVLAVNKFCIVDTSVYISPNPNQLQKDILIVAQK